MRKARKYKLQDQSNTIKLGNMLDDMWGIHLHIMRLQRRYYRMFGKNLSASRLNAHVAKLKKRTKPHWAALCRVKLFKMLFCAMVNRKVLFLIISKTENRVKRRVKSVDPKYNRVINTTP